ncbi:MAG: DUF4271 domain-containing protein [Flavobacteriales bacterium TMED288]|nr:hypothetical protein [Flavobacteriales bacterium]RPG53044.1 MAG: DUF4271 domain-containing protein [Flavobacteriales bacterium TMED288]
MKEILRKEPQSSLELVMFFFILMIYLFLYYDNRKLVLSYLKLIYSNEYLRAQEGYKKNIIFPVLTTIQTAYILFYILKAYLNYFSKNILEGSYKVLFTIVFIAIIRWFIAFILGVLFESKNIFKRFVNYELSFFNYFFTPIVFLTIIYFLNNKLNIDNLTFLFKFSFISYLISKVFTGLYFSRNYSLGIFYIILYFCLLELMPFLWIRINLSV